MTLDRPMMSEREIAVIDDLIGRHKHIKTVLEWGSGGSTVYFPKEHPEIERWVSVEHDPVFGKAIMEKVAHSVEVKVVPLEEYLSSVSGVKADLILIDGVMRRECLMLSKAHLNPYGLVLLHDAGRSEYQDFIGRWEGPHQKMVDGEIPETKVGFAHRGLHIFQ